MTYKEHISRTMTLAMPVVLSQLGHVMVGVADSVMVGRLGTEPLAAASLSNSIFFVFFMFGVGVSYAITPLVAAADGSKNTKKSARYLNHGFIVNLLLSFLLFALLASAGWVLPYLNQPEEVVELAKPYLSIIALSLVPFMFFQTFKQFIEGLSMTKHAMYITIGANVINIVLNYLLIYGKAGFPALGLTGAGIATLISRVLMGLIMWLFVRYHQQFAMYWKNFRMRKLSTRMFRKIIWIGVPTGMQYVFEVGAFSFSALMIGWLGAEQLAAHQIAINLASVTYMMAGGISTAAMVRVGNQLGRQDIPMMRAAGFACFGMVAAFMAVSCVLFIIGNQFFPSLYIDEAEVIRIASGLLIIAAFFQISDGVQVVGLGALRGLADVKVPTYVTLVAYWVIGLPIGYLLAFPLGLGVNGVWYGLLIGLSVTAVLLLYRFHQLSRKMLTRAAENTPILPQE
jgi:multidrug resistance protein, MATE family